LRPDFVEGISKLRHKLINKIKPKRVNGENVNGAMLCELAANYIEVLNSGEIPVIENIWTCVQKTE